MTAVPGMVIHPCDPYPTPPTTAAAYSDCRHSVWLTQVLGGLRADELQEIARAMGLFHPREFEQELLDIQRRRR